MNRKEIHDAIENKKSQIENIKKEIEALSIQDMLLCDDQQWYTEDWENIKVGRKKEPALIGRIHWNEDFADHSTNEVITITRQQIVRVNGVWE